MEWAVWVLMVLFCLNRLIFWVLAAAMKRNPSKLMGTILYLVVGSTDLFWFLLPIVPQPRIQSLALLWRIIGLVVAVIGISIMRQGSREFNKHNVSIRPDRTPTVLVTEGIYGTIRHPLYVGLIIVALGWSLVWVAVYSLYFVPVIILLNILNAVLEERYILGTAFGDEHREYTQRVGMFIPKKK